MKFMDYPKLWFNGIFNTEAAIKTLQKEKPGMKEGIASAGLIGLIAGLFFGIVTLIDGSANAAVMAVASVIMVTLAAVIGLIIFAYVFRAIAGKFKGKASIKTTVGFFGIYGGAMAIALLPLFIFELIAAYTNSTLSLALMAIGTFMTAALSGTANGLLYQMLSENERVKLPKAGLMYGTTTGLITAVIMLVGVAIASLLGIMIPVA